MTSNPYFFTPHDLMDAERHLGSPGAALVLNMSSGKQIMLTSLSEQKVHGRLSGRDLNEFPVFVDPTKVESYVFATADEEDDVRPTIADPATIALLTEREAAIEALVARLDADANATCVDELRSYKDVTERLTAMRDGRAPSALMRERPAEFGGYDGGAAEEPHGLLPSRSGLLDEPVTQEPTADVLSIGTPNRRGGKRGKP